MERFFIPSSLCQCTVIEVWPALSFERCKVDVWRLAQIAGHSSIAMSMRYVHPQGDPVLDAMALPSGQVFGHTAEIPPSPDGPEKPQLLEKTGDKWWAVQDSNLRPPACKAGALTS